MRNQFLYQTSTLYECCINKLQQGERTFTFHILSFGHPTMSIPNTRPDSFFREGKMLKEGSRERTDDWVTMMGLSTQVLLQSLSPGLCSSICSSQLHLHHSSQVRRISLLENRGNPTFTCSVVSTRNWLPWGYLTRNVWTHFWLSWLKEEVTAASSRGRGRCDTPCNVQVPSPTKTCLVQMSTLLRFRKPTLVLCKTRNA